MRSDADLFKQIMKIAEEDERIRAVTMEGSRSNPNAVHDEYSDFDICYIVTDIRPFTADRRWIEAFGDILILQCPCDWHSHPYDYNGHGNFTYLIQFADGLRLDLNLVDIRNISMEAGNTQPRTILLNKDHFPELVPVAGDHAFHIQPPSEKEYADTCNEFRWLSLYVSKGICRKEFYYAKYMYDVLLMPMCMNMLNWKTAIEHGYHITTGACSKYLKRFLDDEEMEKLQSLFPDGTYEDIQKKLFLLYDYFADLASFVATHHGYVHDRTESDRIRVFLQRRLS